MKVLSKRHTVILT